MKRSDSKIGIGTWIGLALTGFGVGFLFLLSGLDIIHITLFERRDAAVAFGAYWILGGIIFSIILIINWLRAREDNHRTGEGNC